MKLRLLLLLVAAVPVIVLSSVRGTTTSRPYASQIPDKPEVVFENDPKSPLEIVPTSLSEVTGEKPKIEFAVLNKSSQPVIAYAIQYETFSQSSKAGGSLITNEPSESQALQPGQTDRQVIGDDATYSDPIRKVILYVDYVELANGSNWGPDVSKASETLAGERIGANIVISGVKRLLQTKNAEQILKLLDREDFALDIPPSATSYWTKGFRAGVGTVKSRLQRAYQESGVHAFESEINKPFDASGKSVLDPRLLD
jgi:hypothetical protein